MERESIELANASTSAIRDFTKVIADNSPRFSFFVFKREGPGTGRREGRSELTAYVDTFEGLEEAPLGMLLRCSARPCKC